MIPLDANNPGPPTLDLIRAAQRGDREARETLFTRYLPRVRRIVALRLRRPVSDLERVEDLVQDALLKALGSLDRFEEREEGTFRSWLAHCVQSAIVDQVRSAGAKKRGAGRVKTMTDLSPDSLASSIFVKEAPSPSKIAAAAEEEARLEEALLQLEDHYREAIVLVKLCGMSSEEAARTMGFRDAGNVRQLIFRAMKKLRELMGADEPPREA
jgi:RNA polymerase sigma-70 factor (ECF subfamily)